MRETMYEKGKTDHDVLAEACKFSPGYSGHSCSSRENYTGCCVRKDCPVWKKLSLNKLNRKKDDGGF
jgi:hypothetical protein